MAEGDGMGCSLDSECSELDLCSSAAESFGLGTEILLVSLVEEEEDAEEAGLLSGGQEAWDRVCSCWKRLWISPEQRPLVCSSAFVAVSCLS